MTDQVLIVTDPDDTVLDGYRILLVDLTIEQSQAVSLSLLNISLPSRIVLYSWNSNDNIEWLLDKKVKCNTVLFNADSHNDLLVGYLSAHPNSYYFGQLRLLAGANNSRIYGQEDCQSTLDYVITKNGKI
jgi:hypothetical protein